MDAEALAEQLSMTEIIRLQDVLSRALKQRFEKRLALVFSDLVGSTPYFARFGDEAGRKLQQRHVDLLATAIGPHRGRIVDTAGDGAFLCFEDSTAAARAMVAFLRDILTDNDARAPEHRLQVRIGGHLGPVLTDGAQVSGDAVNFCSRVATSADSGELRLSAALVADLTDPELRLKSRRLKPVELKGVEKPAELYSLEWLDTARFPSRVRFEDGTEAPLPPLEVIRFGRLAEQDGEVANEVVLSATDASENSRISRWHFELHRRADGFRLRAVSNSTTAVDGQPVARGEELPLPPGARVVLGGVVTLEFVSDELTQEMTLIPG